MSENILPGWARADTERLHWLQDCGAVLCFEKNVDGGWTVTLTDDENGDHRDFVSGDLREAIDRAMEDGE